MELIDIIYEGLQISIALLGVVIILSYLISRLRLKSKKTKKEHKVSLNVAISPSIVSEPVLKNNFYYNEALKYQGTNKINNTNTNLIYLKSSEQIFRKLERFNSIKKKSNHRRYTIINEEIRKKYNNSVINFL